MANISMNEAEVLSSVDNINLLAFDENNIYKFPLSEETQKILIQAGLLIGKKGTGVNAEIFNDYQYNQANGNYSTAFGHKTIANGIYQQVGGKFNAPLGDDFVHIIGYGTSNENRKNIYKLDKYGNADFEGDVLIKGDLSLYNSITNLNQKSHQVFVQSSQPSGGEIGDIWCKPI